MKLLQEKSEERNTTYINRNKEITLNNSCILSNTMSAIQIDRMKMKVFDLELENDSGQFFVFLLFLVYE